MVEKQQYSMTPENSHDNNRDTMSGFPINEFSEQFTGDFKTNPEKGIYNSIGQEIMELYKIQEILKMCLDTKDKK